MSASKRQRQSFQGNLPRKLERIFEKLDRDIDNARVNGEHAPERPGMNPSSISENSTGTMWTF